MAERTKFKTYLIFSIAITASSIRLSCTGSGAAAGSSQLDIPFSDFAGSTIVHMSGGGGPDGGDRARPPPRQVRARRQAAGIPATTFPTPMLGAFILFFGWFGFNPGSELAADNLVPQLAVKTLLAAAPAPAWRCS